VERFPNTPGHEALKQALEHLGEGKARYRIVPDNRA
jgi:hypothetical protein